jgi:hypothetical protein
MLLLPQSTESGVHSIMMVKSAQPGEGGACRSAYPISTITNFCYRVQRVLMAIFWRTFHHDGKISPILVRMGGARPPPPPTISTITSKVVVCFCHRVQRVAITTFWRTFHHDGKISPAWWGWGVHVLPLSYIYHHKESCSERSNWEADTLPLFLLYPYMYSVVSKTNYKIPTGTYSEGPPDPVTLKCVLHLTKRFNFLYVVFVSYLPVLHVACLVSGSVSYNLPYPVTYTDMFWSW